MFNLTYIGLGIIGGIFFFLFGYVIRKYVAKTKFRLAEERAKDILDQTKKEVDNRRREIEIEAKDLLHKMRSDFENETKDRRRELGGLEKRLIQKEENLDKKVDLLDRREREIVEKERNFSSRERSLLSRQKELEAILAEEKTKLQRISGLSREEAKKILLKRMENEVKREAAVMIKQVGDEAKANEYSVRLAPEFSDVRLTGHYIAVRSGKAIVVSESIGLAPDELVPVLGTMVRTADWFGIRHLVCSPESADAFGPKVVQSSMGSILRVQVHYLELGPWIHSLGDLPIYATLLDGENLYDIPPLQEGLILVGNESRGLAPGLAQLATRKVTIPRKGGAESLNASVAAGIVVGWLVGRR